MDGGATISVDVMGEVWGVEARSTTARPKCHTGRAIREIDSGRDGELDRTSDAICGPSRAPPHLGHHIALPLDWPWASGGTPPDAPTSPTQRGWDCAAVAPGPRWAQ